jgi:heme peroxidase
MNGVIHHGQKEPPGIDLVPLSRFHHGRFGRLFRNLDPTSHSDAALEVLAAVMVDNQPPPATGGGWQDQPVDPGQGDNPGIPAGYTYLGQFIDHDVTFDPASSLQRANDPNALHNFRTPRYDLDSLYGEGPDDEPFLYDGEADGQMLIGRVGETEELDLPRNGQGRALTGDPRNDENVVVSQIQLLFLRAHNKLRGSLPSFEETQRQLRWHYQYLVVQDFLRRIAGDEAVDRILGSEALPEVDLQFFGWSDLPYMPVEFSVAAYRFGHSMVRPIYDLNSEIRDKPIFHPEGGPGTGQDLRGFQPLLPGWSADWSFFFETTDQRPQASRLIDIRLAPGLATLPFVVAGPASLALRNLQRGRALGLPSGEAIARRMGLEPLSEEQLGLAGLGVSEEVRNELRGETPLWIYILREAEVQAGGQRLGEVGGRIVAETLIGLLHGDPFSYLNIDPAWTPSRAGLVAQSGERLKFADFIRFVQS